MSSGHLNSSSRGGSQLCSEPRRRGVRNASLRPFLSPKTVALPPAPERLPLRLRSLLVLGACTQLGCSEAPVEVACPGSYTIGVQPTTVTLAVGDSARVQGEVIAGCGESHYDLLWSTSDPAVAEVVPRAQGAAMIRGRSVGAATVYVRWQQNPNGNAGVRTTITEER